MPWPHQTLTVRTLHFLTSTEAVFARIKTQHPSYRTKLKRPPPALGPNAGHLKNEGKSKLIIILKACPGDAFSFDTSICQSCVVKCFPLINIFRDQNGAL